MSTTTEETAQAESAFLELHKGRQQSTQAPEAVKELNQAGIQRFELLKFPHSKHEMFTYVRTVDTVATPYALAGPEAVSKEFIESASYSACEQTRLVLVNGFLNEELSNTEGMNGVKVSGLSEALGQAEVRDYLRSGAENENDVFASLNAAFFSEGIFIDVPADTALKSPVLLLCISTGGEKPKASFPRLLVRAGRGSESNFIVKFVGQRENYLVDAAQDFILEENSCVGLTQIQADLGNSRHFCKTRVRQKKDSRFNLIGSLSGARLARDHFECRLQEPGAEMSMKGVTVLRDEEQAHRFIRIHHEAPHCVSEQNFKNVINDQGRSSIDGTVIVNQGAQLTRSDQLINNLMLSDGAHADGKPNLMIFADDVKCTHGNTVGQIDGDQLFYLQTRGLSREAARSLLTTSFAQSIIESIPHPEAVADLNDTLLKKLEAKNG